MAFGAQPKDSNNIPIGSPYVPGTGFAALKGSTNTNTDGSTNLSTAAALALEQSLPLSGQLQNAQAGSANGSTLSLYGMGSVLFEVIMTGYTGTVNFEGAGPNANYDPLWVNQFGTNTVALTVTGSTTTATHLYELANASGLQTVRARTSGAAAGTVTVNAYALPFTLGARVTNTNITSIGGVVGQAAMASSFPVVIASNQSAVPASQSGTWTVQPGNTPNTSAWLTQPVAGTTGGSTPSHTMSGASTNATSLKASAGLVYGLSISNVNASARFFKLYNKASAPTVGTDTPILTLQIPASGTVIRAYPVGLALGTGIAWACTTGIADSDTGSVGANDLSIDIDYK